MMECGQVRNWFSENWDKAINGSIHDGTRCPDHSDGGHRYAETNRTEDHRVLRCVCGQVLIDVRPKETADVAAT